MSHFWESDHLLGASLTGFILRSHVFLRVFDWVTSGSDMKPLKASDIQVLFCFRDDAASSSTFTLEDSAICLTSEQSTVDVDHDEGSDLDVYLVSYDSVTLKEIH